MSLSCEGIKGNVKEFLRRWVCDHLAACTANGWRTFGSRRDSGVKPCAQGSRILETLRTALGDSACSGDKKIRQNMLAERSLLQKSEEGRNLSL